MEHPISAAQITEGLKVLDKIEAEIDAISEQDIWSIAWERKEDGRSGTGTNQFTLKEATRLSNELNADYPDIKHWPVRSKLPRIDINRQKPNA